MSVKPVIVRSEDELIGLLRGRRIAVGMSHGALDQRIGWADGYASKVEAPHRAYGRRVIWGLMATLSDWLQGLGLALVLMDRREAEALVAGSAAPDMTESRPEAYPGRSRDGGLIQTRQLRLHMTFSRAA